MHTYEYMVIDDHGNWTQRLMVRYDIGGKKKENVYEKTTVRKIEYFGEESPAPEEAAPEEAPQTETEATPEETE